MKSRGGRLKFHEITTSEFSDPDFKPSIIETGGNYGSMGPVVFGCGEDRTRGGDTSCDATENLW